MEKNQGKSSEKGSGMREITRIANNKPSWAEGDGRSLSIL